MAYVVARRNGRFEVRESQHTPRGPRARSLAGFSVLTGEVLATAARRAIRPFDAGAVIASARRARAPVARTAGAVSGAGVESRTDTVSGTGAIGETSAARETGDSSRRFVEASRRMALSLQPRPPAKPTDPGVALIDLLGFADAVTRSQPARPFEPLEFPVLFRLVDARRGSSPPGEPARKRNAL